jgi:hypothetical protein
MFSHGKSMELKKSDIAAESTNVPKSSSSTPGVYACAVVVVAGELEDKGATDGICKALAILRIGSPHRSTQKSARSQSNSARARSRKMLKFTSFEVHNFLVVRSPHSIVHRKSTVAAETRRYEVSELFSVIQVNLSGNNLQGIQNSFICDLLREAIKSTTDMADSLSTARRYCRASEPVDLESLRVAFLN